MNDSESAQGTVFFLTHHLNSTQIAQLTQAVNVVDIADTKIFRPREMGISVEPFAATSWFLKAGDTVSAALAQDIEMNIHSIYDIQTIQRSTSCTTLLQLHGHISAYAN